MKLDIYTTLTWIHDRWCTRTIWWSHEKTSTVSVASCSTIATLDLQAWLSPWGRGNDFKNIHDDVMKWQHFPRYWLVLTGSHQWHGALVFSLIWTNGRANNRDVSDLSRHRAYYDVTVMTIPFNFLLTAISNCSRSLGCILKYIINGKSKFVLLMVWCRQTSCHYWIEHWSRRAFRNAYDLVNLRGINIV